jgi:hypothetical protein
MRHHFLRFAALAAAGLALAACGEDPRIIVGSDPPGEPEDLALSYTWVLEGYDNGQPVGYPAVDLSWLPPTDWRREPFRVYGRRVGGQFFLVATVTSCTNDGCTYRDRDVSHGQTYEYYVATVNEDTGEETTGDFREVIGVPVYNRPATVGADSVVALDDALFLRWRDTGNGANLSRYIVYLTRIDNATHIYQLGETDATGFLDLRAENGVQYGYRVAAVDTFGHVGPLSAQLTGVPRPDVTAELVYAFSDNAAQSGFRFQDDESVNPIVAGTSASAHWRLESDGAGWRIVPLNGASVVEHPERTTALACGPAADASCRAVTHAPAAGYQTTPIAVDPEFSYVFRVPDTDGIHYGVVRVTMLGTDAQGRDLAIFDWAYQLRPGDVRLDRGTAR